MKKKTFICAFGIAFMTTLSSCNSTNIPTEVITSIQPSTNTTPSTKPSTETAPSIKPSTSTPASAKKTKDRGTKETYPDIAPTNEQIYTAFYTVEHYLEQTDHTYGTPIKSSMESGKIGELTEAQVLSIDGYTPTSFEQVKINKDGSTSVKIYYTFNTYTVKLNSDDACGKVYGDGSYTGNDTFTLLAKPYIGYEFLGWYENDTLLSEENSISAKTQKDIDITAKFKLKDEFANFKFESTETTCKITGLQDTAIESISIPEEATELVPNLLATAINLKELTLSYLGKDKLDTKATLAYLFNNTQFDGAIEQIDYYDSKYYLPASLETITYTGKTIPEYSFANVSITSLFIPNAESIGEKAFTKTSLSTFTIPTTVKEIGEQAFYNCNNLYEIYNLSSVDLDTEILTTDTTEFKGVILTDASIPTVYKTTEEFKFLLKDGSYHILSYTGYRWYVTLPDVEHPITITPGHFSSSADFFDFGNNTIYLEDNAFNEFKNCEFTHVESITKIGKYAFKNSKLSTANLPNCTYIDKNAFEGCKSLTSVSIPKITEIKAMTFSECINLTTVEGKIPTIEEKAFYCCSNLKNIDLSDTTTIGEAAFKNCSSLAKADLKKVSSLGKEAFRYSGLTNLELEALKVIPENAFSNSPITSMNLSNVQKIDTYAFLYCAMLSTISLPNTLTAIEDNAFQYCTRLYEITNNSSLALEKGSDSYGMIAKYALYVSSIDATNNILTQNGFKYKKVEDEYILIGYDGTEAEVTIPEKYVDSESVSHDFTIEIGAFTGTLITSITFPDSVTTIDPYMFYGATSLETIHLNKVTTIGESAFIGCTSLKSIDLSNVTTIKAGAFYGCSSLKSVTLKNTETLDNQVFADCDSLESITLTGVKTINSEAFKDCNNLKSISLPDAIQLANKAFENCNGIESIYLGENLKTFDVALSNPSKITSINFENVEDLGTPSDYYTGIYNNLGVEELNLSSVKSIPANSFGSCKNLKKLILGESLTSIGAWAFYYCNELHTVELNTLSLTNNQSSLNNCPIVEIITKDTVDLTTEANKAFLNHNPFITSTSLCEFETIDGAGFVTYNNNHYLYKLPIDQLYEEQIVLPESYKGEEYILKTGVIVDSSAYSVVIPEKVKEIEDKAFIDNYQLYDIYNLSSISLSLDPEIDKTGISEEGVALHTSLDEPSVILKQGNYLYKILGNEATLIGFIAAEKNAVLKPFGNLPTSIEYDLFYNNSILETLVIEEGIIEIGSYAFENCTNLRSVVLPNSLKTISSYAFSYDSSLTYINLKNVECIEESVFEYCENLSSITFNEHLKYIDKWAFEYTKITSMVIPNTVEFFNASAFYGCEELISLEIYAKETSFSNGGTNTCSNLKSILIDSETVTLYSHSFNETLESLEIRNGIEALGVEGLNTVTHLKKLVLPDSLTYMSANALYACYKLEELTIPFVGKTPHVNPNTATEDYENQSLGYLFGYYSSTDSDFYSAKQNYSIRSDGETNQYSTDYKIPVTLKKVTVTGSSYLYDGAFANCRGLEEIVLPNTIKEIGGDLKGIFYGCTELSSLTLPFIGKDGTKTTGESTTTLGYMFGMTSNVNKSCYSTGQSKSSSVYYYLPYSLGEIKVLGGKIAIDAVKGSLELKTIDLRGVQEISYGAFMNCNYLNTVYISDSCKSYGENAFSGADASNIYYSGSINSWFTIDFAGDYASPLFGGYGEKGFYIQKENGEYEVIEEITLPDTITVIKQSYFSGMSQLKKINLPDTVTSIEDAAFMNCSSLKEFTLPASTTAISDQMFLNCKSLKTITLHNGITLGSSSFSNCVSLTSLTLPEDLTEIPEYAFANAKALMSIAIPETVTSIESHAFDNCLALYSITLPSQVTTLKNYTFYQCTNLLQITLGSGITTIENNAIVDCGNLVSLVLPKSITSIGDLDISYKVYYLGTEDEFLQVSISDTMKGKLENLIYYYSETKPEISGNYWHYVNNKIVKW